MNNMMRWAAASIVMAMAAVACSSSDSGSGAGGAGGSAGSAGSGGSAGAAGDDSGAAGAAGDDGGADVCGANASDDACTACLKTNCCDEYTACDGQAECKAAYPAFATCLGSDSIDNCGISFVTDATDTGSAQANDVLTCANDKCATECAGASSDDAGTE